MAKESAMGNDLLRLTQDQFCGRAYEVAESILSHGYVPDIIVGIFSGGVDPAKHIMDCLYPMLPEITAEGKDEPEKLVPLFTGVRSRYYDDKNCALDEVKVIQDLPVDITGKKVLLVDDVGETGFTGKLWVKKLEEKGPSDIKFVNFYVKPWCEFKGDYDPKEVTQWVVFPSENNETIEKLIRQDRMHDVRKYFTEVEIGRHRRLKEYYDSLGNADAILEKRTL